MNESEKKHTYHAIVYLFEGYGCNFASCFVKANTPKEAIKLIISYYGDFQISCDNPKDEEHFETLSIEDIQDIMSDCSNIECNFIQLLEDVELRKAYIETYMDKSDYINFE